MTWDILGWMAVFFASLVAVLAASDRLVAVVESAGDRYQWPPGLVGLLAALGADGPEVTAAFLSLTAGAPDVGLGVIFGSNLFNLAALLGLPAVLIGYLAVQRSSLILSGTPMLVITGLGALLVLGARPAAVLCALMIVVLAGYGVLLVRPSAARDRLGVPADLVVSDDRDEEERAREREIDNAEGFPSGLRMLMQGLAATAVVIGGCTALVHATLYLAPHLGVPNALVGTFGLAVLTSLPNVWVAVALARRHRGAVLVSAACNSNTINMAFGICMPALFHAWRPAAVVRAIDIPSVLLFTTLAPMLLWRGRGIGRTGGAALIGAYAVFAVLRLRATI